MYNQLIGKLQELKTKMDGLEAERAEAIAQAQAAEEAREEAVVRAEVVEQENAKLHSQFEDLAAFIDALFSEPQPEQPEPEVPVTPEVPEVPEIVEPEQPKEEEIPAE